MSSLFEWLDSLAPVNVASVTTEENERQRLQTSANGGITDVATVAAEKTMPDETLVWQFLFNCPFTWRMLELAADVYQAPLNTDDLADVKAGLYLSTRREVALQHYLVAWADKHPNEMRALELAMRPRGHSNFHPGRLV